MKFYIQNTHRGFLGNSIIFWKKGNNGYTAKLKDAQQFTYAEAEKICKGDPEKNRAWPVDYIDNNEGTAKTTDFQYLDKANIVKF